MQIRAAAGASPAASLVRSDSIKSNSITEQTTSANLPTAELPPAADNHDDLHSIVQLELPSLAGAAEWAPA